MNKQRALFLLVLVAGIVAGCGSGEPGDDPKSTALKPPAPVDTPGGRMPTSPTGNQ